MGSLRVLLGGLVATLFFSFSPLHGSEPQLTDMERAFGSRDWKAVDLLLTKNPSSRDRSLAVNALWLQKRWADALTQMEQITDWPQSVAPYASLYRVLALERLERKDESRVAAQDLVKEGLPPLVRFYGAYALSRLTDDGAQRLQWLRQMVSLAGDKKDRRLMALKALAVADNLTVDEALALLRLDQRNAKALQVLEGAETSPEQNWRLGWAAYLAGRHSDADRLLEAVPLDSTWGQGAAYYRAISLTKLSRATEAKDIYEKLLTLPKSDYITRSLQRLSLMIGGSLGDSAEKIMEIAATGDDKKLALQALHQLASSRSAKASGFAEELLKRFPDSPQASQQLWSRGWKLWVAGDAEGALEQWTTATKGGETIGDRLLFWRIQALRFLKKEEEAKVLVKELVNKHRFSFYSLVLSPDEPLWRDIPLPKELTAPPSELEQWGFLIHARMELAGRTDGPSRLASARISSWLGLVSEAYADVRPLTDRLLNGDEAPSKEVLKLLWPRPFQADVEAQAKELNVDAFLVWAVMRQESAFDPAATSWVGASGLLQLMPGTAKDEARRLGLKSFDVYNGQQNIALGTSHLAWLQKQFDHLDHVIAAYNGGSGNVRKWKQARKEWAREAWIEAIPFEETREYVKKVQANYQIYQKLYEPPKEKEAPKP